MAVIPGLRRETPYETNSPMFHKHPSSICVRASRISFDFTRGGFHSLLGSRGGTNFQLPLTTENPKQRASGNIGYRRVSLAFKATLFRGGRTLPPCSTTVRTDQMGTVKHRSVLEGH